MVVPSEKPTIAFTVLSESLSNNMLEGSCIKYFFEIQFCVDSTTPYEAKLFLEDLPDVLTLPFFLEDTVPFLAVLSISPRKTLSTFTCGSELKQFAIDLPDDAKDESASLKFLKIMSLPTLMRLSVE